MTLQSSGAISIQNITTELGQGQLTFGLNDANGRILAGVPSGTISLANFYGKGVGHGSTLFNTVGAFSFTVPPLIFQVSVRLRGGGGGGGRGVDNGSDVFAAGAGGSGYLTEVVLNVTPGQVISGFVGAGGLGNSGAGDAGNPSSIEATHYAPGGSGGAAGVAGSYTARAGGTGAYNGTSGYSVYSSYYLGGNGAGTGANGYIVTGNSSACLASKGGNSQFGGYVGGSCGYAYSGTFSAYYGGGGGGAGDLGNGSPGASRTAGNGGNGGGGGGGSLGNYTGGNGGNGYVLFTY